jgi:hypothetical protein
MYQYIIYISNFVCLANDAARECDAIRWTIAASLSSSSPYDGDGVRGDDDEDRRVAAITARAMLTLRRINDISRYTFSNSSLTSSFAQI